MPRGRKAAVRPAEGLLERIIRRNCAPSVGAYFREVARASVVASMVAGAAGCSGGGGLDLSGEQLVSPMCDEERVLLAHGLRPTIDPEYLAAYGFQHYAGMVVRVDASGTPCASAEDAEACAAALAESEETYASHLVTTDGDEVSRMIDAEEVRGFLGPVDTAQEAVLLVWHAGYTVGCGDTERYGVREVEGGYEVLATRLTSECDPIETRRFLLFVASDGTIEVLGSEILERDVGACIGRRPPGLLPAPRPRDGDAVGLHLAGIARLEASAVTAFEVLARELEALGAPSGLVARAREAAADEVRHAETMAALARRFGQAPAAAKTEPRPLRSLPALALDNATEGCVRETFGALVGTYQAEAAGHAAIAEAMGGIAEDETRHAELSWAIAEWAEPLLSAGERAVVSNARRRAAAELRAELAVPADSRVAAALGLPAPAVAVAMADRLDRDLWC
ncbi:MAG: ferritin-like domain-containing protein [Myxococcota bacterium]